MSARVDFGIRVDLEHASKALDREQLAALMTGVGKVVVASAGVTHPDESTLAAFIEGQLTGDERERVVEHLADCADCRELFAEVVGTEDEPDEFSVVRCRSSGAATVNGHVSRHVLRTDEGERQLTALEELALSRFDTWQRWSALDEQRVDRRKPPGRQERLARAAFDEASAAYDAAVPPEQWTSQLEWVDRNRRHIHAVPLSEVSA